MGKCKCKVKRVVFRIPGDRLDDLAIINIIALLFISYEYFGMHLQPKFPYFKYTFWVERLWAYQANLDLQKKKRQVLIEEGF